MKKTKLSATPEPEEVSEVSSSECVKVCKISKLELDFGRGDLNLMRDKLNELIEKCQ